MIIAKFHENIKSLSHISNHLFQKLYNEMTSHVHFESIRCPYCNQCHWAFHAYYERSFFFGRRYFSITITRVICMHCKRTHAILPDFLVPYSRTPFSLIIEAVNDPSLSALDDSHISYWKNRCAHSDTVSYFLLCIVSKRSFSCVLLFPHDFLAFSRVPPYNDGINIITR